MTDINNKEEGFKIGNKFLLWSGWRDSTLLLHYLLNKYKGEAINTVYIKSNCVPQKQQEIEIDRREKILERFTDEGYFINDIKLEMNIDTPFFLPRGWCNFSASNQTVLWLFALLPWLENDSEIYFGFISGDGSLLYMDKYNAILKNACELFSETEFDEDMKIVVPTGRYKNIKLMTPLKYLDKSEVISKLLELDLFDITYSCETPRSDGSFCGECNSCKKDIDALLHMQLGDYKPKKIFELLRKYRIKMEHPNSIMRFRSKRNRRRY